MDAAAASSSSSATNSKILVLTTTNAAYRTLAANLLCSAKLHSPSIRDILMVTTDADGFNLIKPSHQATCVFHHPSLANQSELTLWGSSDFSGLSFNKLYVLYSFLKRGYSVLYLEPDSVLLGDPFPFLAEAACDLCLVGEKADIAREEDCQPRYYDLGTSFIFARPSAEMLHFFHEWIQMRTEGSTTKSTLIAILSYFKQTNRIRLTGTAGVKENAAKVDPSRGRQLVVSALDNCLFTQANLLQNSAENLEKSLSIAHNRTRPIFVHASYNIGLWKKIRFLKASGLWFSDHESCVNSSSVHENHSLDSLLDSLDEEV